MKKAVAILFCAVFLFAFVSCGNLKPSNTSDAMYQLGLNALAVADEYIAGKITDDEAESRIEKIYNQAEIQEEAEKEELGTDTLSGTKYANDYYISLSIYLLRFDIMGAKYGYKPLSEVIEGRDKLADELGK